VAAGRPCWLLIGNSRWHWAETTTTPQTESSGLRVLHLPPPQAPVSPPVAWAAVGPLVSAAALSHSSRLELAAVPLAGTPAWLGVDRALAGWWAHQLTDGPVLVVDAGTVLSMTRVDGAGRFRGGRLMAGAGLQLRAMAAGAAQLSSHAVALATALPGTGGDRWPLATVEAMLVGVQEGLAAAIGEAARAARASDSGCRIVLTGGDGKALLPLLRRDPALEEGGLLHRPDLCLEALVALRPVPAEVRAQARPRSSRI
jgi:type III pantothenate kinase